MVSQRDGVIAELRNEACTLWASGWLAFRRKAAKDFLGLDFNLQVLDEEEAEESVSEDEADPKVFPDAPSSVPFPGEVEAPTEVGSSPSPAEAFFLIYRTRRLVLLGLLVAPPQTLRPFRITFASSSKPWTSIMPTLVLLFYGYSSFYLFSFPVFFYDPC